MTDDQVELFLAAYRTGDGLLAACEAADVSPDELARDVVNSPALASRLRAARRAIYELIEGAVIKQALGQPFGGDPEAALAYLRFADARRTTRLQRKAARLQLAAAGPPPAPGQDLALLTDDQWARYDVLWRKSQAGLSLSGSEAIELVDLLRVASEQPRSSLSYYAEDEEGG